MRVKRNARIAILISLAGVGGCLAAVAHFMLTIQRNQLFNSPPNALRDLYLSVGQTYTQGFIVGFFFCFSLAIAAVAISAWVEHSRANRQRAKGPQPVAEIKRPA